MKITTIRDCLVIAACATIVGVAGLYGFEKYQTIQKDRAQQAEADVKAMSRATSTQDAVPDRLVWTCNERSNNSFGGVDWLAMRSCIKQMRTLMADCRKEATADSNIDFTKFEACLYR